MRRRLAIAAFCALGFWIMVQSVVVADEGVSIDLGSINIHEPLQQGGSYRLPEMEVTNPGDEVTQYRMSARPIANKVGLPISEDWFVMVPGEFTLNPGESRTVIIELNVPADAQTGSYQGLVGPTVVSSSEGASIGAAVAARLTFEVPSATALLSDQVSEFLSDNAGLVSAVGGMLLIVVAVLVFRRRFTFRIERR